MPDPHSSDPNFKFDWPVGRAEFDAAINSLWTYVRAQKVAINKIRSSQMATQDQVDALTAELTAETSSLNAAVAGIQAEIAALQAANPAVDLTALQAQADALGAAVSAAAALVPAAPPAV